RMTREPMGVVRMSRRDWRRWSMPPSPLPVVALVPFMQRVWGASAPLSPCGFSGGYASVMAALRTMPSLPLTLLVRDVLLVSSKVTSPLAAGVADAGGFSTRFCEYTFSHRNDGSPMVFWLVEPGRKYVSPCLTAEPPTVNSMVSSAWL